MVDYDRGIYENVKVGDMVTTGVSLHYDFEEKLFVGGKITSSPSIDIKRDKEDPNYITGFEIRIQDPSNEKIDRAKEDGNIFLNYLSAKSGFSVKSKLPMIARVFSDYVQMTKTVSADAILVRPFDLDTSSLASLFGASQDFKKRIAAYSAGISNLKDRDFEAAVNQCWKVIENSGTPEELKYKPLRHACDHQKIDGNDAINSLRNYFGMNCTLGEPVSFDDPNNYKQLVIHAKALKEVAENYLKAEVAKLNI